MFPPASKRSGSTTASLGRSVTTLPISFSPYPVPAGCSLCASDLGADCAVAITENIRHTSTHFTISLIGTLLGRSYPRFRYGAARDGRRGALKATYPPRQLGIARRS